MTNFDNDEAVTRLQRVLERTGMSNRLPHPRRWRGRHRLHIGSHALYWVSPTPGDEILDAPDPETDLWLAEEDEDDEE